MCDDLYFFLPHGNLTFSRLNREKYLSKFSINYGVMMILIGGRFCFADSYIVFKLHLIMFF